MEEETTFLEKFKDRLKVHGAKKTPIGYRFDPDDPDERPICFYCAEPLERPRTVKEHVWPQSLKGSDEDRNKVYACRRCNSTKRDMHPVQWLTHPRLNVDDWVLADLFARILTEYYQQLRGWDRLERDRRSLAATARVILEIYDNE